MITINKSSEFKECKKAIERLLLEENKVISKYKQIQKLKLKIAFILAGGDIDEC